MMAGSLSHIVNEDGKFTMDLIENLRDAWEALDECFVLIYELADGDSERISAACRKHNFPDPWKNEFGDNPKASMCLESER